MGEGFGQGDPSAEAVPDGLSSKEKRFEVVATILLGFAALATAWAGYQASLWDGIQSSDYTQASASRTAASQQRTAANQFRLADLTLFESHIVAYLGGDDAAAEFFRQRFREEFVPAYEAWIAEEPFADPDAPSSPFVMPEYQIAAEAEAERLEARAEALFREGEEANDVSDTYTLATLLFALVLFFAAVSERLDYQAMRFTLLGLAGIGLVGGLAVVATQRVTGG